MQGISSILGFHMGVKDILFYIGFYNIVGELIYIYDALKAILFLVVFVDLSSMMKYHQGQIFIFFKGGVEKYLVGCKRHH